MSKIHVIIYVLISLLLTSCISDPDGYLKRSGNRKLVSGKNVYSKKRMPIQNKKYIHKAKKNLIENNYDDDDEEYDEYDQNPSLINRKLYMKMIEQEQAKKRQDYKRDRELKELELEEREKQLNQKIIHSNQEAEKAQKNLQAELQNIKSVLNETKEQMASMSCLNKNKNLTSATVPDISSETDKKVEKTDTIKPKEAESTAKSTTQKELKLQPHPKPQPQPASPIDSGKTIKKPVF